ncbi:Lrp/AsnC family transcriptional regulator [Pseudokordiimonas caeni]|uniref:Lrp/AsnC family transcriptional regulator n=1 Tax=Pseudokordiimonas caeni TaxID=2997908 RepID=UPI0028112F80|nr:Lrp/AsnC family transcriptional regulator [Pseudokordiimonas caeni]
MIEIDAFDIKILARLQANSRQTAETISAEVGLSPAACQRRIKRLREEGVIAKEIAILNPKAVGGRTTLIVQVNFAYGCTQSIDSFREQMLQVPEVQQGYYVTGEYDFVLIMTVKDMLDYDRITRELFFTNPSVGRFQTIVAIDTFKSGFTIPLGTPA